MTKEDARRVWRIKEANQALKGLPDASIFIMILDLEAKAVEKLTRKRIRAK